VFEGGVVWVALNPGSAAGPLPVLARLVRAGVVVVRGPGVC
jgi:hypothetical protein